MLVQLNLISKLKILTIKIDNQAQINLLLKL